MINEEKYKTATERLEAFRTHCDSCKSCQDCDLTSSHSLRDIITSDACILAWLALECEPELKPCPFCGGEAKFTKTSNAVSHYYYVSCRNKSCNIRPATHTLLSKENAVAQWNERANND